MSKLQGTTALVTGAARGQGREYAVRLAQMGSDVVLVDLCRDLATVPYAMPGEDELKETARLVESTGRRAVAHVADIRDRRAMEAVVDDVEAQFGRLDIVVANAAIAPLELDPVDPGATWRDVIDINLSGSYNTVAVSVPMLMRSPAGNVVFINSTAGLKGSLAMKTIGGYAYTAAKHGVVGLTRAFATELALHGIRVNCIHPSGVDTPMVNNPAMAELMANRDLTAWTNLLPVGRLAVSDVADALCWLVSQDARFVTGISLPVDAGFAAK